MAAFLRNVYNTFKYARIEQSGPPDDEGWLPLSIQFETEAEACQYILGIGPQAEVLEPQSLRERVLQRAQEVIAFYEQKQSLA